MTQLSRFAVDNKRAMVFSALLLALIGLYLIFQIPQDVFPAASFPRIAVLVDHGYAPLKQMEMEIVKPIEEAVMGVPGVRVVRSTTSRGSAEINVDFQWSEDMFKAYQLVQAQVGGIRSQLPAEVQIEVRRFTSSTYPVSGYSLYSDRLDMVALNDLAIYTIRPQLTSIPGVNNIEVMGGHRREYWVNLDPNKLAAFNLDYRQVSDALAQTNTVQFVGRLNEFNKHYLNIADNRYRHSRGSRNRGDRKHRVLYGRGPFTRRSRGAGDGRNHSAARWRDAHQRGRFCAADFSLRRAGHLFPRAGHDALSCHRRFSAAGNVSHPGAGRGFCFDEKNQTRPRAAGRDRHSTTRPAIFIEKKEPRLQPELFQVLPDRLNDLSGEIAPILVKVFSNNLQLAQEVAGQVAESLEHIANVVDCVRRMCFAALSRASGS